jgi:O-antigen/teichoic acid export membrane protein
MANLHQIRSQLWNSAVVWSWAFNGLRVGSALILLPLLVSCLSTEDLGMHYVLLSLGAVAIMFDFGFRSAIWRAVCVALAGGDRLQEQGLAHFDPTGKEPNYEMLWDVVDTARHLYRRIATAALMVIGTIGTAVISLRVTETTDSVLTWIAWGLTLAAAVWEIYAGWWSEILNGMNQVLKYSRISVVAYGLKLALAALLLGLGVGLPSVAIAALVASTLERLLARRACLTLLPPRPKRDVPLAWKKLVAKLWPNGWRQGLVGIGTYSNSHANSLICLTFFGLAANSELGLSLQMIVIAQGMASVWTQVKWPLIGQLQARRDLPGIRKILRQRLWLQTGTYVILVATAISLAQPLLGWLGSDKTVLVTPLLILLAVNGLLEMHLSAWGALIATENRIPVLWPLLITNAFAIVLAVILIQQATLGMLALIVSPLLAGMLFNYWYWPGHGAKRLETGWSRLLFLRN